MITVLIGEKKEQTKEIIWGLLSKIGNTNLDIVKEGDAIKIIEKKSLKELVSLKDKVIELEDSLLDERRPQLYKALLEEIEKPLFEHILERTDGNQLKAARILGLNRNTLRSKLKKLGINTNVYKL